MATIPGISSHIQATSAYKKTAASSVKSPSSSLFNNLKAVHNKQPPQPMNILRQGDIIDMASSSASKAGNIASFAELLQALRKDYVRKLKRAEAQTASAITNGTSLVEVMAAVQDSEVQLQKVVAVRDRLISSYQEILRMPL